MGKRSHFSVFKTQEVKHEFTHGSPIRAHHAPDGGGSEDRGERNNDAKLCTPNKTALGYFTDGYL